MNKKGLERLQSLMNQISEWSDLQFANGEYTHERALPISYHLQKESKELTEALEVFVNKGCRLVNMERVGEELADGLMLLLDCATHVGYDADDLITSCFNKLEVNKNRKWGSPDANGVVEHIR